MNIAFLQNVLWILGASVASLSSSVMAKPSTQNVLPFTAAGYSATFSRSIDIKAQLTMRQSNDASTKTLTLLDHQAKGESRTYFGRTWLAVPHQGMTLFDGKTIHSDIVKLYDPVTLRLMFDLDPKSEEVTSYVWEEYPDDFPIGLDVKVGVATRRDKSGIRLSQSSLIFVLNETDTGYEFCEKGQTIDSTTNVTYDKKSCDIFDKNQQILGSSFERLDAQGIPYIWGQGSLVVSP